jgi:hypothetical protein
MRLAPGAIGSRLSPCGAGAPNRRGVPKVTGNRPVGLVAAQVAARPTGGGRIRRGSPARRRSGEDAYSTRADQQADDDQHDPPENLGAQQRDDACDDEHYREDPQKSSHDR